MKIKDKVVVDWEKLEELCLATFGNQKLVAYLEDLVKKGRLTFFGRNWVICLLYEAGQGQISMAQLGECFGNIERERVSKILQRVGFRGINRLTHEDKVCLWFGRLISSSLSRELVELVMKEAAADLDFWAVKEDSRLGMLKRSKVLEQLGLPFANVGENHGSLWQALLNLGLLEEDGLVGVVLRYGLGWDWSQTWQFVQANYLNKDGATLEDLLAKINDLARQNGLMTIASPQSLADYLRGKGLEIKKKGSRNPHWLRR